MSETTHSGRIEPHYFGKDLSLYGCYHRPAASGQADPVVICQPFMHEYERCHRAMRQLAVQSAKKGILSLRFDYYGTGDSAGSGEECSLARMRRDIDSAILECRERTGSDRVALVGLRLGATLAAQIAVLRSDVEALVLYSPVMDGGKLLHEWGSVQREFESLYGSAREASTANEVLGYPIEKVFQDELEEPQGLRIAGSGVQRALVLAGEEEARSGKLREWIDILEKAGVKVLVETTDTPAIWERKAMDAIVPIKPIRRIIQWISGG